MPRSFDDIYQIAPPAAVRRLTAFREAHPYRTHEREGMLYRVWDLGQPEEEALLFLPSGMGDGEVYFPYLLEMSRRRRCIAVSLPACKHMADFARQIHGIVSEDLGVRRVTVIGSAIGGLLAQVYARAYPKETAGLILLTTGAPCKELPDEDCLRWTSRRSLALRYRIAPFDVMRGQMGYQTFHQMCPEELQDSMTFWRAFISETYEHSVYKSQYINLNCIALPEIYRKKPFFQGDMAGWDGRVLILESAGDQYYGERERALLRGLYPGAVVEDIGPNGQFALMADETRLIARMEAFLDGKGGANP
ncbi:MAG: alpha/beta fold hydrolase [Candidatus Spyradocola sp.]|jgi:pimeloyl-ACP methyl ester carboxylesterase